MKNIYKILSAAFLMVLPIFIHAQTHSAPVGVVKQEQNQWCWAADSKCILDYYGFVKSQCTIVEYARTVRPGGYFGNTNCCSSPSSCNKPNEMDQNYGIMGMLDHFGKIGSVDTKSTIPVTKIISELKAQRPFVMGIMWSGGGGHVVVACAYNETTQSITMMDSWQNNGMTTKKYTGGSSVSTNSGSGNWAETLTLTTSPPTSVTDLNGVKNLATIFPNPSSAASDVTINSDQNLKSILVFNSIGQLVNSYNSISDKSFSLKIPVAGLYSLQVTTEEGTTNKKVVIQ